MKRTDGRMPDELRKVKVVKNFIKHAEGSCLIECGATRVICTASVEDNVPPFLRNSGTGWVTAEYNMLPRSTATRIKRSLTSGRNMEIQRLVGRSLRSVMDMAKLGERTIRIDCDVIQADGGTRTASITGGFIAMGLAILHLKRDGVITDIPLTDYVAAVSVGIVGGGGLLLDLNYDEDSVAEVDMNVVMTGKGKFVEVQGTAEGAPFSKKQMDKLLELAKKGIKELTALQAKYLSAISL